jgi:Flp pilus assembly protein TadD/GR25 family glycosyltransferase involved in LPS biosynthesis
MQGRFDELIELLRKTLQLKPNYPDAHINLGIALKEQGDLTAAIASYNTALKLKPNYPEAHNNLGNALQEQGDLTAAIAAYNTALKLKPNYPEAHYNLGNALKEQGELTAAIASYNTALKLKPNYPEAHWNSSLTMLLGGDYKNGWEKYEWRTKTEKEASKPHALPKCDQWSGELALKTTSQLLLVTEQGLGDTLQFMRYATALRNQGLPVSFCAQPKLHNLIQASGIDPSPLTPQQANEVSEGQWIPLLSVPRHLEVSPEKPIITEPYIKTTDELHTKWAGILSAEQRPIIGINWQGNPKTEKARLRGRSLALETFAPITGSTQISLLSLQKGFGSEQLETCSFKDHFVSCQDQINDTWDFLETAAIIVNCDLVITSDTSVAHLAGGMGKTTWLLLHKVPDWRWGLEGDSTFWYPSIRLFRQKERGNWEEVMRRVAEALQEHLKAGSTPSEPVSAPQTVIRPKPIQDILVPLSLGELIDKITILQIKTQHLQNDALENVKKELEALETTLNNLQLNIEPTFIQRLREVNQDLWQIEDAIRDQERKKNFGATFIDLARSVYQQNDRRAAIKREINTSYGSTFVEEKSYSEYTHKDLQEATTLKTRNSSAWETLAITLEPTDQRYLEFKSNNKHLEITAFAATRGAEISKQDAARQGIATEELLATSLLTPGALGCAASHRAVWEKCSNSKKGFLVMEDDCYTHPEINKFIAKNLERLMGADICFFGINTDSILQSRSSFNLTRISLFYPKHPSQDWIRTALLKTDIRDIEMQKLEKAFGTCAYFVSPKGAQKLNQLIFPLSLKTTDIPLISPKMPAVSIDRSGCSIYSQLDALVCEPFLAYTPNTDSSTKNNPGS